MTKTEPCERCGTPGQHLMVTRANYEGSHENQHPLCDSCLRKLGEWFRGEIEADSEEDSD